jgi:hypothetical protein
VAKKVTTVDDLDGSVADMTLRFGYGGAIWEIDFCADNYAEFEQMMAPYIKVARQYRKPKSEARKPKRPEPPRGPATIDKEQAKVMRAWAAENGIPFNPRGRVSQAIVDAWQKAHGG